MKKSPKRYLFSGLFLIFLSIFTTFSIISFNLQDESLFSKSFKSYGVSNLCGVVGSYLSSFFFLYFGYVSFFIPIFLLTLGVFILFKLKDRINYHFFIGSFFFFISLSSLLEVSFKRINENFLNGGIVGYNLTHLLLPFFNYVGTFLILCTFFIFSILLLFDFNLLKTIFEKISRFFKKEKKIIKSERGVSGRYSVREKVGEEKVVDRYPSGEEKISEKTTFIDNSHKTDKPISPSVDEKSDDGDFSLPPSDFLIEPEKKKVVKDEKLREKGEMIVEKLKEFNVSGEITEIHSGPVVTTYEFKLAKGIKYSKIISLSEDLCLKLKAPSVRISKIPGKGTVGIEVPNEKPEIIRFRDVVESEEFKKSKSPITLGLGKLMDGSPFVEDLSSMPHLLIAGSTGSGKSVGINTMVSSILYKSTPEKVRFIMIDPKGIELNIYDGIPHLLIPVVLEHGKAVKALKWAYREVKRRNDLLGSLQVRNIVEYNMAVRKIEKEDGFSGENLKPLPYIVIVIDEFADLTLDPKSKEVEKSVLRIAQLARASGIHLILATQRPDVKVVTGLIKANFPARISYKLVTRIDSKTILDTPGAESLLGKGDMLYKPPTSSVPIRAHGAFISTEEVKQICDFWKSQEEARYENILEESSVEEDGNFISGDSSSEKDPLYGEIIEFIARERRVSTSLLQRRFKIGYGRAARIVDELERDGYIGPPGGPGKPRDVLIPPDYEYGD